MGERDLTPRELEERLGYNSDGLLVRMYLGELETSRAPSNPFLARLAGIGFDPDQSTAPREEKRIYDIPARARILADPKQCPECVAEAKEGKRSWADTWYVFPWGNQKYCCVEHRRAWYRRQAKGQERSTKHSQADSRPG